MTVLSGLKDRSHYGILVRDVVVAVTPEQARTWLNTKPPAPTMWTRGAANNEKSHRLAAVMAAGEWDNDRGVDPITGLPVEPVMIWEEYGCVLGGHHRTTAVTILGRPIDLRVLFWSKPKGWDRKTSDERRAMQKPTVICDDCGWWAQDPGLVQAHTMRAHR